MGKKLNIIYFVDANKTRSIEISIKKIKLMAIGFGLIISWTVISIFVFAIMQKNYLTLRYELKQSQSIVFDYQTRYEGVFEKTYPQRTLDIVKENSAKEQKKEIVQ